MASEQDVAQVGEMIKSLYQLSGILPIWDGEVTEEVAAVFGIMLFETQCSQAFRWVPRPPGGRASINCLFSTSAVDSLTPTAEGCLQAARGRSSTSGEGNLTWHRWVSLLGSYRDGREKHIVTCHIVTGAELFRGE